MAKNQFAQMVRKNKQPDISLLDDMQDTLPDENIVYIPKHDIYSIKQIREHFPEEYILSLQKNMEKNGQRQAIRIGALDSKGHVIQEGECRWRAAMQSATITHLACVIGTGNIITQLSENILRQNLTPFEEGRGFLLAMKDENLDNKGLANALGISESRVSAAIKASKAPAVIEKAYIEKKIGDVDTVNSLRIAYDIEPSAVERLLESSKKVSRTDAQGLTKDLKAAKKSKTLKSEEQLEIVDEGTQEQIEETVTNDEQKANNLSPEKAETKSSKNTKEPVTSDESTFETQERVICVEVEGEQGYIHLDSSDKVDNDKLMIMFDSKNKATSVPVEKVKLLGYGWQ